jgi:cytosine permease
VGFADDFLSWLRIIGLVAPPFAGVVIAHFWVLGRIRRTGEQLVTEAPGVRVEALVAWLAASVVTGLVDWFIDAIVGLLLGGLFYLGLALVLDMVRRPTAAAAGSPASRES